QTQPRVAAISPGVFGVAWEDGRSYPNCVPWCLSAAYGQRVTYVMGFGRASRTDIDGDGKDDLVARSVSGMLSTDYSANGWGQIVSIPGYGASTDYPAPADYDGDGKSDMAILDGAGTWKIDYGSNGLHGTWEGSFPGHGGGTPVPGDYDRDGKM